MNSYLLYIVMIESESTIVLTRRESLWLLKMIEKPPPRNEVFLRAQARYQGIKNGMDTIVGRELFLSKRKDSLT